jgi:hypothetical protein
MDVSFVSNPQPGTSIVLDAKNDQNEKLERRRRRR